jgi:hypothetical protein
MWWRHTHITDPATKFVAELEAICSKLCWAVVHPGRLILFFDRGLNARLSFRKASFPEIHTLCAVTSAWSEMMADAEGST